MNISTSIRYRHALIHCFRPRVSKMKNLQKQTAIGPRCRMVREDLSTYFGTFARHESWMFSVFLQSALALSFSLSLYLSLSASSHSLFQFFSAAFLCFTILVCPSSCFQWCWIVSIKQLNSLLSWPRWIVNDDSVCDNCFNSGFVEASK